MAPWLLSRNKILLHLQSLSSVLTLMITGCREGTKVGQRGSLVSPDVITRSGSSRWGGVYNGMAFQSWTVLEQRTQAAQRKSFEYSSHLQLHGLPTEKRHWAVSARRAPKSQDVNPSVPKGTRHSIRHHIYYQIVILASNSTAFREFIELSSLCKCYIHFTKKIFMSKSINHSK